MMHDSGPGRIQQDKPDWYKATSIYERPDTRKASWQIIDTFIPYVALWGLMIYTVEYGFPYWTTFAIALVAAVLLVRIFIFFHDCCHGSFFASSRANRILGYVSGILTFTPYEDWDQLRASLEGCSFYRLPGILRWITGNIGLHHIHHIRPRIPNYNLQQCYKETPALQEIIPLTFCKSLKTPWLNLWDEKQTKLISFRALKQQQQQGPFQR